MWNEIKGIFTSHKSSREQAKGRLHLVLAHDRTGLDGAKLQELRRELSEVLSRYVEVELEDVDIRIERIDRDSTELKVSSPMRARSANATV